MSKFEGITMTELIFLHPLIYVMAMVAIKNAEVMNMMESVDK